MTRVVPTVEQLRNLCGAAGQFDACTRFVGYRLTATCSLQSDGWKLDASATFRPWLVLLNVRKLPHELEHISDVERRLSTYVSGIGERRFDSSRACATAAAAESSIFGATMKQLADASNLAMHPTAVDGAVARAHQRRPGPRSKRGGERAK